MRSLPAARMSPIVLPEWCQCQTSRIDADVRTAVLRKRDGLRQIPDERRRRRPAGSCHPELLHAEKLDAETYVRFLKHLRDGRESISDRLSELVLRNRARRRKHHHHLLTADRRAKRRVVCQLGQRLIEGRLLAAERQRPRHREVRDRWFDLELGKQRLRGVETGRFRRTEIPVHSAEPDLRGQPCLVGAAHASRDRAVQRHKHRVGGRRRPRACEHGARERGAFEKVTATETHWYSLTRR